MEPNMWQRIRAAALREAADLCNTRASVEGIAQACADDIRALRDKPAAICPRCGATDCVGCLTSNPKASAEDYTTVAELDRWIEEATHYTIKTPAAERHLQLIIRARDELQELEYIFELQRSRMGEATKFWQEATQQPDIWPDLGKLLEWLCNEIVLLTDAVKAESDKALEDAAQMCFRANPASNPQAMGHAILALKDAPIASNERKLDAEWNFDKGT